MNEDRAYIDPNALVRWLPPKGMRGRIEIFDPRNGGEYRIVLTYLEPDRPAPWVASAHPLKLLLCQRASQTNASPKSDPDGTLSI